MGILISSDLHDIVIFNLKGVIHKALKRRLSNTKPVVKPQGRCEKKRRYLQNHDDSCKNKPEEPKKNPEENTSNTTELGIEGTVLCNKYRVLHDFVKDIDNILQS